MDADSFSDLIAQLKVVNRNDAMAQLVSYSVKGSTSKSRATFTGPGVVDGSVKVSFKIG